MENSTQNTELISAENEVWKREVEYWDFFQALDLAHFETLFNANVIGWSALSAEPIDKKKMLEEIKNIFSTIEPGTFTYNLTKYSVRVYGNMADVFYLSQASYQKKSNGQNTQLKARVLHNWVKEDKEWQIVSGMSSGSPQECTMAELLNLSLNEAIRGSFKPLTHPEHLPI